MQVHPEQLDASEVPHPWDIADRPLGLRGMLLHVLLLPLLAALTLFRLALLVFCIVAALIIIAVTRGRRALFEPCMRAIARLFLVAFGVWPGLLTVERRGEEEAAAPKPPVMVVAPHLGLLEAFFFLQYKPWPRPIALEPYTKMPIASALFRAADGVAVPLPPAAPHSPRSVADGAEPPPPARSTSSATASVRTAILEHKKSFGGGASEAPICILPEGTTTNGHSMLRFFSGGFEGGGAVQPVVVSFPYRGLNAAAFPMGGLGAYALRLLLTPYVAMRVIFLPVVTPTSDEAADASIYAESVREKMAAAAAIPLSKYSAKDLRRELKERAHNRS